MEFLLVGPQLAGLLHADPHPGNFRMLADGRLGVLDFGAVNQLPDGLPVEMGQLLTMALAGDSEGALEGLRQYGFVKASMDVDADLLLAFLEPFIGPLRTETFTLTPAWPRSGSTHPTVPRRADFRPGFTRNLPPPSPLTPRPR